MSMTPVNRRGVLGLLVAGSGAVLVGCARLTDPVVHGTAANTPLPVPSPDASFVRAADEVAAVRAMVAALPTPAAAPWVEAVTAMLTAHLAVITSRHPLGGRMTPQPWFSPGVTPPPTTTTPTTTTPAGYQQAATTLAAAHATRSRDAVAPALAMLWGSLSVATTLHSAPGPDGAPGPAPVPGPPPVEVEVGDEVGARNVLLAHLHSLAQLLELGLGVNEGAARSPFQSRLAQVRDLVVGQQALIRDQDGDPVGPLPGYDLPGPTGTIADIATTWTLVEQQVFTAGAPVIGASSPPGRDRAITDMVNQGRVVASRGAATTFFPGWV